MELRKITLLVVLLAMGLAAAPAFAQANAVGGSVQYVDCDQIQAAATGQYNVGNQQDLAGIAQNLGVSQNQVSACLGSIAAGRNVNIKTPAPAAPTPKATAAPTPKATATATASAPAALPPTGGAPVLALGAGALLLAGGL